MIYICYNVYEDIELGSFRVSIGGVLMGISKMLDVSGEMKKSVSLGWIHEMGERGGGDKYVAGDPDHQICN